jgi:hypothetical protein
MTRKPREYTPAFYKGYLLNEEEHIALNDDFSYKEEVTFTDEERALIEKEVATLPLVEIDVEEEVFKPGFCIGELIVRAQPGSEYYSKPWVMSIRGASYTVCPVFRLTEGEADCLYGDDVRWRGFPVSFNAETGAYTF